MNAHRRVVSWMDLMRCAAGAFALVLLSLATSGHALAQVVNGCGSGWSVHLVPDRFPIADCEFLTSCNRHDVCYGRCSGLATDERAPHCEYLRCKAGGDLFGNAACQTDRFELLRQQADRRRLVCDSQFYVDISTLNGGKPICRAFAAIYSRAVKWFGEGPFEGMDGRPVAALSEVQVERSKEAIAETLRRLEPEELNALVDEIIRLRSSIDWSKELWFDPAARRLRNR